MMVSLGPVVLGAAQPHPDNKCPKTMLDGVLKRMSAKLPEPDRARLKQLKIFVKRWLKKRMLPLSPDCDLSFETWIEHKNYPESRKVELRETYSNMVTGTLTEKMRKVKAFMKDETYAEYKHGRGIYSRVDQFKCLFGPLCSALEEELYKQPEFIKHIPVADRPKYIEERLNVAAKQFCATDYTSFESSFSKELMMALDQVFFDYMTSELKNPFIVKLYRSLMEDNHCVFKFFTYVIDARRMSGEMNTSLSNGFANLMVMSFLVDDLKMGELKMVVEGDDGLCVTSSGQYPTSTDFAALGFKIKLEKHNHKETASFCGIIYHPDDCINVTDPRKILVKFGWAGSAYNRSKRSKLMLLLRCKSLSNLHQYPGAPIIQKLALYGLRMTKSYDVRGFLQENRNFGTYEREKLLEASKISSNEIRSWETLHPVGISTRLLVEDMYGITIEQQKRIEAYLDSLTTLQELEISDIIDFPPAWADYFTNYCLRTNGEDVTLLAPYFDPTEVGFSCVRVKVRT